MNVVKKLLHFLVIFFAGFRLNTAANVNSECIHFQGCCDIVRINAAGQKYPLGAIFYEGPIEGFSGSAVKVGVKRVKQ